jgi:P4 family phage/plasmid primase-like protien
MPTVTLDQDFIDLLGQIPDPIEVNALLVETDRLILWVLEHTPPEAYEIYVPEISRKTGIPIKDVRVRLKTMLAQLRPAQPSAASPDDDDSILSIGDESECAGLLVGAIKPDGGEIAFDLGALHRYSPQEGRWEAMTQESLVSQVTAFSGLLVHKKPLKVSNGFALGAVKIAYARHHRPGFFDERPTAIGFAGETVLVDKERRTIAVVPSEASHRLLHRYDAAYVPGARPTRFLAAMERWFVGMTIDDRALAIGFVQEFVGACLVGLGARYARAMLLRGQGDDGKSKLAEIIEGVMPPGSCSHIAPQEMDNEYDRASMSDALLNVVPDLPEGDLVDSGSFKAVLAGDRIKARFPYGRIFSFTPRAGNLWSCNEIFKVRDVSPAIRRRIALLEFTAPIGSLDGDVKNPNIAHEIIAEELGCIASWGIDGLARLLERGSYQLPKCSLEAVDQWLLESDSVAMYRLDRLQDLSGTEVETKSNWARARQDVYCDYKLWCEDTGHRAKSETSFGASLRRLLGVTREACRTNAGIRYPVKIADGYPPNARTAEGSTEENGLSFDFTDPDWENN